MSRGRSLVVRCLRSPSSYDTADWRPPLSTPRWTVSRSSAWPDHGREAHDDRHPRRDGTLFGDPTAPRFCSGTPRCRSGRLRLPSRTIRHRPYHCRVRDVVGDVAGQCHPAEARQRLGVVRSFARHLKTVDPATEVPPQDLLRAHGIASRLISIPTSISLISWERPAPSNLPGAPLRMKR